MAKYPKYTREQSLSCKLSDDDIKTIRELRFQLGWGQKEIAKEFNVTQGAIRYWCLSSEERKIRSKEKTFKIL